MQGVDGYIAAAQLNGHVEGHHRQYELAWQKVLTNGPVPHIQSRRD
jgi:hypothetical protein